MKYIALLCFNAGTGFIKPGQEYNGPCIEELIREGCLEAVEGESEIQTTSETETPKRPRGRPKKVGI